MLFLQRCAGVHDKTLSATHTKSACLPVNGDELSGLMRHLLTQAPFVIGKELDLFPSTNDVQFSSVWWPMWRS